MVEVTREPVDFFISYNHADREWATWIAWILEDAGYTTVLEAWDFRPGGNFVVEMNRAIRSAERVISVLSPDYLAGVYTVPEWATAFAGDPHGVSRRLVPVVVRECEPDGLLRPLIHLRIAGLPVDQARDVLLDGVRANRGKPADIPRFPGPESSRQVPPGAGRTIQARRFPEGEGSTVDPVATTVLPAGTRLWRVHPRTEPVGEFGTPQASRHAVLYVTRREVTALLEGLLRGVDWAGPGGERVLDRRRLDGMLLSTLRTTRELVLACADEEPDLVGLWPPDGVHGIEWPAALDMPEPAIVLLGERCPPDALWPMPGGSTDLADVRQLGWLRETLREYRVQVPDPPAAGPKVYISHRVRDSQPSGRLDGELRARLGDAAVFGDDRSLRAGVDLTAERLGALRAAKMLLVVVGEEWEAASQDGRRLLDDEHDRVRQEIAEAFRIGLHVVPVLVGARSMVNAADLPADIRRLADLEPMHLRHRHTDHDVRLLVTDLLKDMPPLGE